MLKQNALDIIMNGTFKHAKKLARDFYFDIWTKNPPRCSAFNGEVIHISRIGWEHTARELHRSKMDILGRFCSLERAKKLLETATQFQDYEKRNKNEYWAFDAAIEDVKIRVIVESIRGNKKHFLSVIRKGSIQNEIQK